MKIPSLFIKTPRHKRFSFVPRYYKPEEEERKNREERLRRDLQEKGQVYDHAEPGYRHRIAGSFRSHRRKYTGHTDASAALLRLIILTFLSVWLIAFLHFGKPAVYGLVLFIPFYFILKYRKQ
jgi:Flp pilus assembly protein TadB